MGHACVTTGRRGFSMPSFFEEAPFTLYGKRAPGAEFKTLL
ncbi:hypothetical protein V7056_08935 [Bacillus sp. JJ664]